MLRQSGCHTEEKEYAHTFTRGADISENPLIFSSTLLTTRYFKQRLSLREGVHYACARETLLADPNKQAHTSRLNRLQTEMLLLISTERTGTQPVREERESKGKRSRDTERQNQNGGNQTD